MLRTLEKSKKRRLPPPNILFGGSRLRNLLLQISQTAPSKETFAAAGGYFAQGA